MRFSKTNHRDQMNSKMPVKIFISYAHKNKKLARELTGKLLDNLGASKAHSYELWSDGAILAGEDWEEQIRQAIGSCDLGLLLVSPAFLASKYIRDIEIPNFVGFGRFHCIPVMLQPVDFSCHDLRGLERLQFFLPNRHRRSKELRAYGECKPIARDAYALSLFQEIEAKLSKQPGLRIRRV